MTWKNIDIPLFEEEDFNYTISIQDNAYDLRIYYNRRMKRWFLDLLLDDGTEILMGAGLVQYYPISADYNFKDLTGFFWLQPKGVGTDQTPLNPEKLFEYYDLFYMWNEA